MQRLHQNQRTKLVFPANRERRLPQDSHVCRRLDDEDHTQRSRGHAPAEGERRQVSVPVSPSPSLTVSPSLFSLPPSHCFSLSLLSPPLSLFLPLSSLSPPLTVSPSLFSLPPSHCFSLSLLSPPLSLFLPGCQVYCCQGHTR